MSSSSTDGLALDPSVAAAVPEPAKGASYLRVFATFFRNSLVREMTFRSNLLITIVTRLFYFVAQVALFEIIYRQVNAIDDWTRPEYFAFLATGMLINSLVETFFMPNCANFSELIRTGNLDFVLLKPIDPQFLISFEKMELAMLNQAVLALALLGYALVRIGGPIDPIRRGNVRAVRGGRSRVFLQPDAYAGLHERVVRPQHGAIRLLVLHHHLCPLPARNL